MDNGKKLFLASFYRPPNKTDDNYTDEAIYEISTLKEKAKQNILIIGGDFNLPDICWEDNSIIKNQYPKKMSARYLQLIADSSLEQMVNFQTNAKNILDLILTTHPSFKINCKPMPSIGNSVHDIVLYDCSIKPHRSKPTRRKIFLWKKANINGIKKDLSEFSSQIIHRNYSNVMTLWDELKSKINEVINSHVPTKMSSNRHSHPWMNSQIKRSIRRKQRAHKKAKRTRKKRDYDRYKKLQQEVKFHIREAHKKYLEDIVSDEFKTKNKKFWSYVKSKSQDSSGVAPLKNKDGFLHSSSNHKAEILNQQFRSAFTNEDLSNIPSKGDSPFPSMDEILISSNGVKKLLKNLKTDKATGPDSIPAFILKTAAEELAPILAKLFQLSLDTGDVPSDWRNAWVVPIFKKGERHLASNYRPVSLTSIVCKVLEHIIHSQIMRHFSQHCILSDSQHGFRQNRSCETQLIMTSNEIAQNLAQNKQVDVILLDFSKAFDRVPHARLVSKLDYYGVRNKTLTWISSFLGQRKQRVLLEGVLSNEVDVVSGVPQGTVLGPLLFLTFINDLPDTIQHSTTKLFADDCLLFRKIANTNDNKLLQKDLSALEDWEKLWQMDFNPGKCNVIRISPSKLKKIIETNYILHNQVLEVTPSSKYLGVNISDDMSWSNHIRATVNKGNKTVGFLRRNFRECTTTVKAATYKTMVRPVLEYASTVWDPSNQGDIEALEMVQRRAARYVFNNYTDRTPGCVTSMLVNLKWEPLAERRATNRLLMLFKIQNGLVDINATHLLKKSDSRTRGAEKLYQEHTKYSVLHNSFFPRTIRQWNKLPSALTETPSLEHFKAGLAGCRLDLQH